MQEGYSVSAISSSDRTITLSCLTITWLALANLSTEWYQALQNIEKSSTDLVLKLEVENIDSRSIFFKANYKEIENKREKEEEEEVQEEQKEEQEEAHAGHNSGDTNC